MVGMRKLFGKWPLPVCMQLFFFLLKQVGTLVSAHWRQGTPRNDFPTIEWCHVLIDVGWRVGKRRSLTRWPLKAIVFSFLCITSLLDCGLFEGNNVMCVCVGDRRGGVPWKALVNHSFSHKLLDVQCYPALLRNSRPTIFFFFCNFLLFRVSRFTKKDREKEREKQNETKAYKV